jgi:hypothetical protein
MSDRRRLFALAALLLGLGSAGCVTTSSLIVCRVNAGLYGLPGCNLKYTVNWQTEPDLVCRTVSFDPGGCPIPLTRLNGFLCKGGVFGSSKIPCGYYPGDTASFCARCEDPLIVELPYDWFVFQSSWVNPATGDSGLVHFTRAADYVIPGSHLNVRQDPNTVAYVFEMDRDPGAGQIEFHFAYQGVVANATPLWCVKTIPTVPVYQDGELAALEPPIGQELDFTTVTPSDLCLGPDAPTNVHRPTWGALKSVYR